MTAGPPSHPSRRLHIAAIALVAACAALLTMLVRGAPEPAGRAQQLPAQAITAHTTLQLPSSGTDEPMSPPVAWQGSTLPPSRPVSLSIPAIGLTNAPLDELAPANGPVPRLSGAARVGWLGRGPSPGELGASVLAGEEVLARLSEVRVGDPITVRRADDTAAVFLVYRVDRFAKLPAGALYGDVQRPELRLLHCGAKEHLLVSARLDG